MDCAADNFASLLGLGRPRGRPRAQAGRRALLVPTVRSWLTSSVSHCADTSGEVDIPLPQQVDEVTFLKVVEYMTLVEEAEREEEPEPFLPEYLESMDGPTRVHILFKTMTVRAFAPACQPPRSRARGAHRC
jgi:hypothetical protein